MNNLHITLSRFLYQSRILKETSSIVRSGLVKRVVVVALHEDGLKDNEKIDDLREVWRIRLRSRRLPRYLIIQIVKYIEFCIRVTIYARDRIVDLVNVHHLALLPLGVLLKWICGAKLIYDAHELETERYGLLGFQQVVARHIERIFIKHADLVIVVGEAINRWYRDRYGLSNIVTIFNGPEFQKPPRTRRLHDELKIPKEKKIVIYQGGLSRGRGIEKLLEVFSDYDDQKHVLVLMGYGELESIIKKYADQHSNIYLKEAVPPQVVLRYTASADVGICFIDNSSLNDYFCLPNKLFEYIMAGLPVIVNNAPEMRRVVMKSQIGIVMDELTSESIKLALNDLANMDTGVIAESLQDTAELYSWDSQESLMINTYKRYIFNKS